VLRLWSSLPELPGWSLVAAHPRFGTATLAAPGGLRVDLAATRSERYPAPGALPAVTSPVPIADDLPRRDFTIHAMARPIGGRGELGALLDPFGGLADLRGRRLRLLHGGSLADDPTRALRGVAYAVRLGFRLDRGFRTALGRARAAGAFDAVSGDRLRRGLELVLAEEEAGAARELLLHYGLLDDICPGWGEELKEEVLREGRRGVGGPGAGDSLAAGPWRLLLSGIPLSKRRDVAERLRFPRALRRSAGILLR